MRLIAALALAACGGAAKPPAQDPRDFPIEAPPVDAAVEDEPPPFQPLVSTTEPAKPADTFKVTGSPGGSIASTDCIPAGVYKVTVNLDGAKLSQVNTGMADMTWCKSLLEAVPANHMATLEVKVADKQLTVEWPPGKPQTIVSTGACSIGITSPPMIAQLTFSKAGTATGAASYAIGTDNHPDERCEAVGAKLALVKQ